MLGQRIGHYQIVRQLGAGGMGAVYEAVHEQLGRRAAIKILHPHLAANAEFGARFINEARAANIVDHPGIVQIFELGRLDSGAAYIVMELLRGESLRERMERAGGPLADVVALALVRQIGAALAAAHASGIVHRDLKPDNVMIVPDPAAQGGERTKLLDFGIAKVAQHMQESGGLVQTQTGAVLGTPVYMAPEQCQSAGRVSDKADVYALGVMLYQMLAGEPPFAAASLGDLLVMHMMHSPPPLRHKNPAVAEPLAGLVHSMLAKNPDERPSMHQVMAALEQPSGPPPAPPGPIAVAQPRRSRGAVVIVGGVAVLAVLVVAAVFLAGGSARDVAADAGSVLAGMPRLPPPPANVDAGGVRSAAEVLAMERTAPPPPRPAPPAGRPAERPAPARTSSFEPRQVWTGEYQCAQGRTDLTVVIESVDGRRVSAVFAFTYPPTGANGAYRLSGSYDPGSRRIVFRPGAWIKTWARYQRVGMDGRLASDGRTFSGRMMDPACRDFRLALR